MKIETSITITDNLFRGNSLDIGVLVNLNLENYKIRAEFFDQFYSNINLATSNACGSNDYIEVTDEYSG